MSDDSEMELTAAATLWGLFSAWLLFPRLGVPRMLLRAVAALIWLEFLAVLTWGFGSETCVQRPCKPLAETGRTAAGLDLPLLALAVLLLAFAYGMRQARRTAPRVPRA